MKEFINKLISRLEIKKEVYTDILQSMPNNQVVKGKVTCLDEVIESVNQLAEEYNNGWIPCSERLPDIDESVLICFSNDMESVIAFRTRMIESNYEDVWINSSTAHRITSNILAWQPLPAPYKQKGE